MVDGHRSLWRKSGLRFTVHIYSNAAGFFLRGSSLSFNHRVLGLSVNFLGLGTGFLEAMKFHFTDSSKVSIRLELSCYLDQVSF